MLSQLQGQNNLGSRWLQCGGACPLPAVLLAAWWPFVQVSMNLFVFTVLQRCPGVRDLPAQPAGLHQKEVFLRPQHEPDAAGGPPAGLHGGFSGIPATLGLLAPVQRRYLGHLLLPSANWARFIPTTMWFHVTWFCFPIEVNVLLCLGAAARVCWWLWAVGRVCDPDLSCYSSRWVTFI